MDIYIKYGHICYMTDEGEMMCPPFVQTKAQAERYFGKPCTLINERPKKRGVYSRKTEKRRVAGYDKEGNLIGVFEGLEDAARRTGCRADQVWKCCRGVLLSTHGFVFRYVEGEVVWNIGKYTGKR